MRRNRPAQDPTDSVPELLRDLMIIELARTGVNNQQIRKIVHCGMNRVTRIAGVIRKSKSSAEE